MKSIKIQCNWGLNFELITNTQIELYVDIIPPHPKPDDVIRFLFLAEPPEIYDLTGVAKHAYENNLYDYLFTHNQYLLNTIDNSYIFPLGMSWIRDYNFPAKKFEVSTLVGGKNWTTGHLLRHELWFNEHLINISKRFFLSGNFGGIDNYNNNPILGNDKSPLFNSQFHICIENVKRDNWFTEKLIDCLITKTVPIYYGCPNIGNWFDERGFIMVNNLKDIINVCNSLTPTLYDEMLPYINDNYLRSLEYVSIENRLKNKILEIVK